MWITQREDYYNNKGYTDTQHATEHAQNINTTQCLYCLCVLIFATDSNCSAPMHILLADAIDANGGSKELIKIMNRVGAVASKDTLQRHIESVSIYRLQKGLTHELNRNALAIVSVDNLDFLQSYAFVYSGELVEAGMVLLSKLYNQLPHL